MAQPNAHDVRWNKKVKKDPELVNKPWCWLDQNWACCSKSIIPSALFLKHLTAYCSDPKVICSWLREEFDRWDKNGLLQLIWVRKAGGFIAASCGKGNQEGISVSDKSVGNSGSYTGKPKQQEAAWDEKRALLAPVLGGETRMDSLFWSSGCSKSTQVCELGESCGKRARRACSLGRIFQVLRILIMMVGEGRRFASIPLATCLYGLLS